VDATVRAFRETIGERIRERRVARGWSQADLGNACLPVVDQTQISRIELGSGGASDEVRLAIARALKAHPADLFAWPDRRKRSA
jgi:transcriptional regulator with XRE-family HTH domain